MRKLHAVAFAISALVLALMPAISAARLAGNHNLTRIRG
jgi:hypothetical protein